MSDNVYKLMVMFEGLCAFVYNDIKKAMSVLLIDGRIPGVSSEGKRFLVHVPSIQVNINDLVGTTMEEKLKTSNFDFIRTLPDESREAVWALDKDDVYIKPENGSLLGEELQLTETFENHIPTMSNLHSGGISVNPKCFEDPFSVGLVAKMRFVSGKVFPGQLLEDNFEFDEGVKKRFSRQVIFELEFDTDIITFAARKDDQDQNIFKIQLKKDAPVVVKIQNMPPSIKESFDYLPAIDFKPDFDFELVYKIAHQDQGILRLPNRKLKVPRKINNGLLTTNGQVCSHARFNNSSKA